MHCLIKMRCGAFCSAFVRTCVLSDGHFNPLFRTMKYNIKIDYRILVYLYQFQLFYYKQILAEKDEVKTALTASVPDCRSSALMLYSSILKIVCSSTAMSPSVIFAKRSVFKSSWAINSLQIQNCGRAKRGML